ncbi:MAG TPA: glycosyltransferase [Burkholderiaceae bacterium]|nr:glycosyltransferase [Burkholderiaceae bacterium]
MLQVVPSVNRATGGPAASVTGLSQALASAGLDVTLASLDYREHAAPMEASGARTITVAPTVLGKALRGWSPAFANELQAMARQGLDVVHNHGVWMYPGVYARRLADQHKIPFVISPRGMLDDWSLAHNPVRKQVAFALYERRNLQAARLLHATSDMEAEAIRRAGLRQPIAVIPNAIAPVLHPNSVSRQLLEQLYPALQGKRWLLYMGRLHPKKGLPMLLEAWSRLAANSAGWHLVIAGPDLTSYGAELRALLSSHPNLAANVSLVGMLEGEQKACALAHAELLVLPTLSENFGIVVLEALAAGMPVITTTAAPWEELITQGCGWWVNPTATALEDGLRQALATPDSELRSMGERGRQLVLNRYSWDAAARSMVQVYRWLAEGNTTPACVVLS